MARKTGRGSTTTASGRARKSSGTSQAAAASTRRRQASEGTQPSDEATSVAGGTTAKRSRKAPAELGSQRSGSGTSQRQPTAKKSGSERAEDGQNRTSKLTSIFSSLTARKVLAAGLVSAAAALVYRKPKAVAAAGEQLKDSASDLLEGAATATRKAGKAARKAGNKAIFAVEAATPFSEISEVSSATPAHLPATDNRTTAHTGSGAAAKAEAPTRKRRSDAGQKRALRTSQAEVQASKLEAPDLYPALGGLSELETSAFALSGGSEPAPAVQTSADERSAEAHPS